MGKLKETRNIIIASGNGKDLGPCCTCHVWDAPMYKLKLGYLEITICDEHLDQLVEEYTDKNVKDAPAAPKVSSWYFTNDCTCSPDGVNCTCPIHGEPR